MDISVAPYVNGLSTFSGYIYVKDQGLDEECFSKPDENDGFYKLTLDMDMCGGADNVTNVGATNSHFT